MSNSVINIFTHFFVDVCIHFSYIPHSVIVGS